ncbi:hypothetical protein DUI87_25067 [Hirundo rustica rustica]|uniref:Uncharacterized protein n=1 Tax=Hirundo rustica rustica TaxID=333673 RepID=A0A3M0JDB3_HIRRU|nr:hypothetical protein DUI87_25065 [Hirundo rustica rustica]RMB98848.1 hypothetical protein DUI87_25067 [Hirundo rustica rustica]
MLKKRDFDMLKKWNYRYFGKFNKEKYQVLYLGKNSLEERHTQMLGTTQLQRNLAENDTEFPVDTKFYSNQQCTPVTEKANSILGYIRRSTAIRPSRVFLPIYWPRLEYCVPFWGP